MSIDDWDAKRSPYCIHMTPEPVDALGARRIVDAPAAAMDTYRNRELLYPG